MHRSTATTSRLQGAYDLHVHCSPDVVPRAQDAFELAESAYRAGMAGIGLKDHSTSTIGRCAVLNRLYPQGPRFLSSIALNPPVGGLNPAAVETALASGVDIVYLPTYSAKHHIDVCGESVTPVPHPAGGIQRLSILNDDGFVCSDFQSIIALIATYDAVLATGHVSPNECLAAAAAAQRAGVKRCIITHASQLVPNMSLPDQRQAIAFGALIEHCFLAVTECCPGSIPLDTIAEQIREVGPENVVLSSDFGQPANGAPVAAFAEQVARLAEFGFSDSELRLMLCDNPERLVGNRKPRMK